MDELLLIAAQAAIVGGLGLIYAAIPGRSMNPRWLVAGLALLFLYDFLITGGFFRVPLSPDGWQWNWYGKLAGVAGMLVVAALPAFGWRQVGIRTSQGRRPIVPIIVTGALMALFAWMAMGDGEGASDLETILFQWTMPGLDEELFYRGVLLLAMDRALPQRMKLAGAQIGFGGLLTSVAFGLAHALSVDDGIFGFDWMTFALTGGPSLILLWLRARTGSLLLPVIAHNFANGIGTLI